MGGQVSFAWRQHPVELTFARRPRRVHVTKGRGGGDKFLDPTKPKRQVFPSTTATKGGGPFIRYWSKVKEIQVKQSPTVAGAPI